MSKTKKFCGTLNEMTGKQNVETDPIITNEDKETINFPTVSADMFNKKSVKFATTVEGLTKQQLRECNKSFDNNDDNMSAFPGNTT